LTGFGTTSGCSKSGFKVSHQGHKGGFSTKRSRRTQRDRRKQKTDFEQKVTKEAKGEDDLDKEDRSAPYHHRSADSIKNLNRRKRRKQRLKQRKDTELRQEETATTRERFSVASVISCSSLFSDLFGLTLHVPGPPLEDGCTGGNGGNRGFSVISVCSCSMVWSRLCRTRNSTSSCFEMFFFEALCSNRLLPHP